VAKSSKGSRKAASRAKRSPRKAKGGVKKTTGKSRAASSARTLEFRKLRKQLEQAVAALGQKKAQSKDGGASIDDAQRRLERWMSDIDDFCSPEMQEFCGPTMDLELSSI
jgi:hypothetical protein